MRKDDLIRAIGKYPNNTTVIMEWFQEGLTLLGTISTIYETDNGKVEGTPSYCEYYACAFRVKSVMENLGRGVYPPGSLIEISADTAPNSITLEDGTIVWEMM